MSDEQSKETPKTPAAGTKSTDKDKPIDSGKKGGPDPALLQGTWTAPLFLSVFASTIGGPFQFGYHIGCINVPAIYMKNWVMESAYHAFKARRSLEEVSSAEWAVTVGLFAVGGMIGGLASGWFADRFGRKGTMLINNIFAVIAGVLMTYARYVQLYPLVMIGRVFIGINAGITSGAVPMYLTEISPINLRGTIGSVSQLLITISICFSQMMGLKQIFGTPDRWQLVFAFTAVPVIIQLCFLPMCPESPKYSLVVKHRNERAETDLKWLRGKDDVEAEMEVMKNEAAAMAAVKVVSMGDLFKGNYQWPMFIAIMMMLAQQLSGINVAMFFSTVIFQSAGLGSAAVYATFGMGACNVLMTIVSVYLVDHPKCGRRMLMIAGLSGMLVTSLLLVISISFYYKDKANNQWLSYPSMVFVYLFVISFATGPGSIPWFLVSELFDSGARGGASSIAAMVNWSANFLVAVTFEFLMGIIMQFAFLIFSAFLLVFIIFTYIYVPETKGRSIEEINAQFKKGKSVFAQNQ